MPNDQEYVLVFTTAYFPHVGGAEVAVRDIVRRLPHYHFDIITARMDPNLPKVEEHNNVTIHRLGHGTPFIDKLILAFYGPIYAAEFAHLHSYKLVWGIMASYGGLAAATFKSYFPQIPYLLTLQEGDDLATAEKKGRLLGQRFKNIFTRADVIQAISHYLMSWAHKMGATGEVRLVPNGVDLNLFRPQSKSALPFKMIITTSRLVQKNGIDTLIKALAILPDDVHLSILGDGPDRGMLEGLARELGVRDRVSFAGTLSHEEMIAYLSQADVFCRPSRSEGLGNSFLEAMAMGLPCVATKVGGIPDFLVHNETGWFAPVDNPPELAKTLKKVLDEKDGDNVKRVVTKAREMVEQKYAIDVVVAQMVKILANIRLK